MRLFRIVELSGISYSERLEDKLPSPLWLQAPLYTLRTLALWADGHVHSRHQLRSAIREWTNTSATPGCDYLPPHEIDKGIDDALKSIDSDTITVQDGQVPKLVGTYEVEKIVNSEWTSVFVHVLFVPEHWTVPSPQTRATYEAFLLKALQEDLLFPNEHVRSSYEMTYIMLQLEQYCIRDLANDMFQYIGVSDCLKM